MGLHTEACAACITGRLQSSHPAPTHSFSRCACIMARLQSCRPAPRPPNTPPSSVAAALFSCTVKQMRHNNPTTGTNGQTTYAWDYENRLTTVTLAGGDG